jgi:hypothetical protein
VAALIAGYGNRVGIFFYRTFYNFMNAAIVPKMNYFSAFALHDSAHDINGSIMPVKQGSSSYDSYFMIFFVWHNLILFNKLGQQIQFVKLQLKKRKIN